MADKEHFKNDDLQVYAAVLTVSDTRTIDDDKSGQLIQELMKEHNHNVVEYDIVPDDADKIKQSINGFCNNKNINTILITGGTGLTNRDTTYEAITGFYQKKIDGFGELFRMISFEEVGAKSMLSRASAGLYDKTVIFSMPGSSNAVSVAMEKLIIPSIVHLVAQMNK